MRIDQNMHKKIRAALDLLQAPEISVAAFEQVRSILRGAHPDIDRKLEICSEAMQKVQKIQNIDVIAISADVLPEKTEEQKKRKKTIIFFINSLRDLQSEIKRIEKELVNGGNQPGTWGKIFYFAKGPFGVVTILALVIAGALLLYPKQNRTTEKPIVSTPTVKGIIYNDKKIPLTGLYVGTGPDCDSPHYHANNGTIKALDGTVIADPEGCGFGKVKETAVVDLK